MKTTVKTNNRTSIFFVFITLDFNSLSGILSFSNCTNSQVHEPPVLKCFMRASRFIPAMLFGNSHHAILEKENKRLSKALMCLLQRLAMLAR